jgi:hypothetical protein
MQRLRGSWLALLGAALLVLFSISVAVGADPETDTNRGQSISGFVHSLIFGEPADEEVAPDESEEDEDEDGSEDEDADEAADEEATEEEAVEANQEGEVTGAEHGACVAEIAQSDAVGGPNENHGGAVSEAARETCWQSQEEATEETPTEPALEETPSFKNHGECVSEVAHSDEVGGPNENHGGAVSEGARETCHESAEEAASTEITVVDSGGEVLGRGNSGNGHGRGNGGDNGGGRGHNK